MSNIFTREELAPILRTQQNNGKKIVFTNGVFDIVHIGHVDYLRRAKELGDILVVAINADESVRRIKGPKRPIVGEADRSFVVANLKSVDYVCIFNEDTPYETIKLLQPDVLVKGADWKVEDVVGRDIVEVRGGKVVTMKYLDGKSTTNIIKRIIEVMHSG
ncbi:MAG: D-glycero-beta-D-manno-heptose 1-phosphate adenylyltransferase [Bacteroidetes bacterium]|nr:D-glycero-beta-D-manno-heptose 1-phosphate adenylyltransferase [Bacteroidota bacterium]MCL5267125.1 D-glycero-beta-D-manno-heptose 1-phosphate adenylyltransferase [Bacteroidota bacterium]